MLCVGDSGTLANGVLETISTLFFMPLVPYPARFARHLPLEGKAMVRGGGILVSLPSPWGKRILNFSLLPLEGGAPKGRRLALAAG